MMKLKINKSSFKDLFLHPISKIVGDDESNKGCILEIKGNTFDSVCNSKDGSVVLYASYKSEDTFDKNSTLNIFDLKKFIRLLDCIDKNEIVFTVNTNHLLYNSPSLKFRYHLMDDGVIRKSVVNINKINSLKFNNEFALEKSKIDEIIKVSVFTEDSNKLYLSCKDGHIYGELTDKTKPNIDSVNILLADSFIGDPFIDIPISMDVLRKIYGIKFDKIFIKVNTDTKVISFELTDNQSTLKYIVSALVK
jgi:hypothetical protein